MSHPIVLDIGDSYDDFFALAAAATAPEIDLVLVTTSFDDGGLRTRVARTLLDAYGRSDVPLATGNGKRRDTRFLTTCLEELKRANFRPAPPSSENAMKALERVITSFKKVTMVVTGPLTNLASLLKSHPHVAHHISEILFVGGWTSQALPEHNVRLDPDAVDYVLKQGIPMTAAGYEVTRGYRLMRPQSARLSAATAPGPRVLNVIYETWCKVKSLTSPGMLDPFIIAYLCGQIPTEFETLHVRVDTTRGPGRGAMFPDMRRGLPIRIFSKVDASRYIEFIVSRVVDQSAPPAQTTDPNQWDVMLRAAYRLRHHPGWSMSKSSQPFHTIALIEHGTGEFVIANEKHILKPGSVLYVPPEETLTAQSLDGIQAFWLYFHAFEECNDTHRRPLSILPWPNKFSAGPQREVWIAMASRITRYWTHHWPEAALLCKSAFLEFFANLCIGVNEQEFKDWGPAQEAALQAKRWIEANVAETITLEEIAHHALLSKYHLLRVFTDLFGMPPLQYQRQLRMEHARHLLRLQHLSIAEVATQTGYKSPTAFSRAYKRHYGIAPSEEKRNGSL